MVGMKQIMAGMTWSTVEQCGREGKVRGQEERTQEGAVDGARSANLEAGFSSCWHLGPHDLAIGFFCAGKGKARPIGVKHRSPPWPGEADEEFNVRVGSSSQT